MEVLEGWLQNPDHKKRHCEVS